MIDWREYIESNPKVLRGKPVIKGTHFSVEFVLNLISGGWPIEKIIKEYPLLTEKQIQAVCGYAAYVIKQANDSDEELRKYVERLHQEGYAGFGGTS
jgi:uncharacterized protein (DUF433 family)